MTKQIKQRLTYLRQQIENESISTSEIAELQSLSEHIDKSDTLLLEWAGVTEQTRDGLTNIIKSFELELSEYYGSNLVDVDTRDKIISSINTIKKSIKEL